jgi:uncharacterized protein (UPF0332 family)
MEYRLHSTSKQLIAAYLEKARQKLAVAERLRDSGDHEDAISRAYYAAFHAVKARLAVEEAQSIIAEATSYLERLAAE